jgi:hypothetical protein
MNRSLQARIEREIRELFRTPGRRAGRKPLARPSPGLQTSADPASTAAPAMGLEVESHLVPSVAEEVSPNVAVDSATPPPPEPFVRDASALPRGQACQDCRHWRRCKALIQGLAGTETSCDWAPSRFAPKPEAQPTPPEPPRQAHVPSSTLPPGKLCRDCASFASCRTQIPAFTGDEMKCEWAPARFVDAPSALPAPRPSVVTRLRPCRARCASTGNRCALPWHPGPEHACGAYRFTAVAAEGQESFQRAEILKLAATRRIGGPSDG